VERFFTKKFFIVLYVFLGFFGNLQAGTLHSVITGDTAAKDIGNPVLQDLFEMEIFLKNIGKSLGFRSSIKKIQGRELSIGALYQALYAIPSTEEDVIVFYYSGHGFRFLDEDQNPWPQFYFSFPNEAASFIDVKAVLDSKPCKTLLIVTDCCNNFINSKRASKYQFLSKGRIFSKSEKRNLELLFLEGNKKIYVTAARQGSFAYCNQRGGLYTRSFFKAFKQEITKAIFPSWDNILRKSKEYVGKFENAQTPYYEITKSP